MPDATPITYRDAGVDIDAGEELVERIKGAVKQTHRPEVLGGLGGFGALCEIPEGYRHPILVSGTDGVGTKLKLAAQLNRHSTIGIDLVAMCVNDIVVCGAEPLQFLDYYATGDLDVDTAVDVISGIAEGCRQAGCALVGGETAEMPGMYAAGDYDLAGFCVGVVERDQIIDGTDVKIGDRLIGLASSGVHSNGYSLVRKLIERSGADLDATKIGNRSLADALLEPTRIYVKSLLNLIANSPVNAIAHITGGGLTENLPRVLPESAAARIKLNSWDRPELFDWLQQTAAIDDSEMLRTFNCGIGMIVVIPENRAESALQLLNDLGEIAFDIGEIVSVENSDQRVQYI